MKPFIPDTADRIFQKLGLPSAENFDGLTFGGIGEGVRVNKGENLFNRIDVEKELKELEKYAEEKNAQPQEERIGVSDFAKVKLCTAEVTECRRVDNSDKLLLLTVKIGEETRKVVSGIAHCYTPEQLVGKTVILVKNLKPCKNPRDRKQRHDTVRFRRPKGGVRNARTAHGKRKGSALDGRFSPAFG